MPSQTFVNLPEEKRIRIIQAAKEEFSQYSFYDASINRIIKEAQIPRGSFYRYFENKEDIYSYIFEDYVKTLDNVFIKNLKASNGNIFDMYIKAFDFVTNKKPHSNKGLAATNDELLQIESPFSEGEINERR